MTTSEQQQLPAQDTPPVPVEPELDEPTEAAAQVPHRKVLSFRAAGQTYAVPIELIKEIIEYGSVTRVPMTPSHLRGVLNLRGAVVPVLDLAARLGFASERIERRTCIVVLALPGEDDSTLNLGMVVESVSEVLDIPEPEIEAAPSFGASIEPRFIDGMAKVRGRFVVILDPETTFAIDELADLTRGAVING